MTIVNSPSWQMLTDRGPAIPSMVSIWVPVKWLPLTPIRQSPCNVCVWQLFPIKTLATTPVPAQTLQNPFSPLETLALTSLDQTIMVLFVFWSNPIGTPVSNGPFFVGTVDAHKQKREAGPFPSLYTAGWVLIKEKNEIQNEVQNEVKTRYGKSPASTHMDFGPQAANLPFLGSLVAKQWQFADSQHTAMAV